MAALCNFNGLAPWRNADNSLHSVNLTMPGKGQRDRVGKTSIRTQSFQARVSDLDPIRVSPYGPAACDLPHREAGHATAPDRMHRADQKLLASTGASTHVRKWKIGYPLRSRDVNMLGWRTRHPIPKAGSTQSCRDGRLILPVERPLPISSEGGGGARWPFSARRVSCTGHSAPAPGWFRHGSSPMLHGWRRCSAASRRRPR